MLTRFKYDGKLDQLYKIWLVNLIFSLFTLGIHGFWGRTRMRRYLVRCLSLQNDRFEYTGRGSELFVSFLKATTLLLFLGIVYGLVNYLISDVLEAPEVMRVINAILLIFYFPALVFLTYVAMYGAMRYRFSKTRWRGVRFCLDGSAVSYAFFALGQTLLSFISLGFLIPQTVLARQKKLINNIFYGNLKHSMDYSSHNLNKINIITLLLAIPTLTLSRVWFTVALNKFIFEHVQLGNIRFRYTMTPGKLVWFHISSFLILLATFGLGYPLIIQRTLKLTVDSMEILGDLNSLKTTQSDVPELKSGEGLEGIFGESAL